MEWYPGQYLTINGSLFIVIYFISWVFIVHSIQYGFVRIRSRSSHVIPFCRPSPPVDNVDRSLASLCFLVLQAISLSKCNPIIHRTSCRDRIDQSECSCFHINGFINTYSGARLNRVINEVIHRDNRIKGRPVLKYRTFLWGKTFGEGLQKQDTSQFREFGKWEMGWSDQKLGKKKVGWE